MACLNIVFGHVLACWLLIAPLCLLHSSFGLFLSVLFTCFLVLIWADGVDIHSHLVNAVLKSMVLVVLC